MALTAHEIASFVKWRLTPVRYMGRMRYIRPHHLFKAPRPQSPVGLEVEQHGYATGPVRTGAELEELKQTFLPRSPERKPDGLKAPFVNLSRSEDFTVDNPLCRLAFSREVFDVALDYFGGRLRLDSLQVLYSFPDDGVMKESQKWHLDYGDSRSLHCVMYLTDVVDDAGGPFVFIDKQASKRVGRGLTIRRIPDDQLVVESGHAEQKTIYGEAGSSVWIDPAACYHYGSRCKTPRVAVFVTFNSDAPFVAPVPLVRDNAAKIAEVGKKLRPDLDPKIFDRLLGF
ncbi:hypothetical protein [Hoeflea ulvae]|uniref:Fe2OG dioxygenase domain-containing protein n=1 Tax=Hoeflea ulvae TaxID=2983764 RepID=A0ABT3YBD9_9HYPH|nr:hypothetical protein [Hoeflea ulvae]MCY0093032.1 hypothetical protein [Hoeflea ulvae]